jgi:hypothetical protein
MKLTIVVVATMACASALAAGPVWNNIAAPAAPTVNIYQQPDYAANVSNGFSKMADALRQYEATQPTPKPTPAPTGAVRVGDRVTWPDGMYGIIVEDQIFLTRPDGKKGVCVVANNGVVPGSCKDR